jgi:superfamily I DNA/RNA helicase
VIKLEQNYRSTPTILKAANAVISNNATRHAKELWSKKEDGDQLTMFHAPTEQDEAQSVVQRMVKMHKDRKVPWNEVFGGTEFFERAEIKDLIAYLRVIVNPLDQEALLRIINVPRRGISDNTLDLLTQFNRTKEIPLWELLQEIASPLSSDLKNDLSDKAIAGIRSFTDLIKTAKTKFSERPLNPTFAWLVDELDYKKAIVDDAKSEKMRDFKWENVAHCIDAMAIYEEEQEALGGEEISLTHFLSNSLLDRDWTPQSEKNHKEDKVNLMTFHSAKGLEFTACFLVGLEDNIIPHEKSLLETGLEEERRLMYVAMTRAKKFLTLSMARKRKKMGKENNTNPSRFLFEIPKELIRITSWQTVD